MPANFSNLRLRYTHATQGIGDSLVIDFNLRSLNFDINHTTIGNNTPFTSEMSFVVGIEDSDESGFNNLEDLSDLLDAYFAGTAIAAPANTTKTTDSRIQQITTLLQGITEFDADGIPIAITGAFTSSSLGNLNLVFRDFDDLSIATGSTSAQVLVTPVVAGENNLFALAWFVKVKFHAQSPEAGEPSVWFPALNLTGGNAEFTTIVNDNTFEAFNNELRLNYELTYFPEENAQPLASPIGKVADDLTDSIANLTTTIANNLSSTIKTQLQPPGTFFTDDVALWVLIKKGTDELSFSRYLDYMEAVFCGEDNYNAGSISERARNLDRRRSLPFMNVDAYRSVKIATEAFVMVNCMVNRGFTAEDITNLQKNVRLVNGVPNEQQLTQFFNDYRVSVNGADNMIPYLAVIRRKLANEDIKSTSFEQAFDHHIGQNGGRIAETCYGVLSEKLSSPCFLELIWSYWHEESMMVQGLNAVCRRFQNIRGPGKFDPLANLEIDSLRPLNNLMWGYVQDHQHRLTVRRRAYEYNHHYGISLKGDATSDMRFADPRSKFIEAFHTLLNLASRYYKQSDDMTVRPDGFPILNGLRETHLILSEGAHNQYGDLPSTARSEMLMEQWLLARPEFREFLPTRVMVAYPEPWMDRVAALNQLMGWTKTSVLHFNYLAIFGEKILLSIRFGNWADAATTADAASNWANFWRPEIQAYIHAYRAATGVDLSADGVAAGQRVDAQQPSTHLFRKLTEQQNSNGQMAKVPAKAMVK